MKNTLKKSKFRIIIWKWSGKYRGICYETYNYVEENTYDSVLNRITNLIDLQLSSIKDGFINEYSINQKPSLKHRLLFYILPNIII